MGNYLSIPFFECSSKTGEGVQAIFEKLTELMIQKMSDIPPPPPPAAEEPPKSAESGDKKKKKKSKESKEGKKCTIM